MSKAGRAGLTFVVTAALVALVLVFVFGFLRNKPAAIAAANEGPASASLTLQTVAAIGPKYGNKPDWVSYLVLQNGQWVHSTIYTVPAHATVHVTIYQYDSASGLRNPLWALAQGVVGGTINVDGKTVSAVDPASPGHTFGIPDLGVYVPLPGVGDNAANQCGAAPCTTSMAHHTITFAFRTGAPGVYRWQCFVPCGAGYYFGNGGPMQTFGYMGGFLRVVQ